MHQYVIATQGYGAETDELDLMKIVVNPTWRCTYSQCTYCWVRALGWHKRFQELNWRYWMRWIQTLPLGAAVDFSGGEPLIYPGFVKLLGRIYTGVVWAFTSNLSLTDMVDELCEIKIPNCLGINMSLHPQTTQKELDNAKKLRDRGYPIRVNKVDHPSAPDIDVGDLHVTLLPYQPFNEGHPYDGICRVCNAGQRHLVCDPIGNVYRCSVYMQRGLPPLGTIEEPLEEVRARAKTRECRVGCTFCYTYNNGADWLVEMTPCTIS